MTSKDSFYSSLDSLNKSIIRAAQALRKHPLRHSLYVLSPEVNKQLADVRLEELDYSTGDEGEPTIVEYALGLGTGAKSDLKHKDIGLIDESNEGQIVVFMKSFNKDLWYELKGGIQHQPAELRMVLARQIPNMLLWYGAILSTATEEVYKLAESIDQSANPD